MELIRPRFGITPETLDPVDVSVASHRLILSAVNFVGVTVADINQTIIAVLAVRMGVDLNL